MSQWIRKKVLWGVMGFGALVAGCGSDQVNIGDGQLNVDKNSLSSYAATWEGYVEAYTFPSGTDRVRVVLDENGTGRLQVGEGGLVPASDPNVGYPPAVVDYATRSDPWVGYDPAKGLWDGVGYPLVDAQIQAERIRWKVDLYAAYSDWCALQTPVYRPDVSSTAYACVGPFQIAQWPIDCRIGETADSMGPPIDCIKALNCSLMCPCRDTGCTSLNNFTWTNKALMPNLAAKIETDLALSDDGKQLVGSILFPDVVGARTLRLKRVP
jgi:hypothetical protein